jgi:antitoxin HicB
LKYVKEPYSRILIPNEDGTYSGEILEFPGCFADGDTPDEVMRRLDEAARSWVESAMAQGQAIPQPEANQDYSGHLLLRLPKGLHRQAARMAAHDEVSLNQFIVSCVSARVGAEDLLIRLSQRYKLAEVANYDASLVNPEPATKRSARKIAERDLQAEKS